MGTSLVCLGFRDCCDGRFIRAGLHSGTNHVAVDYDGIYLLLKGDNRDSMANEKPSVGGQAECVEPEWPPTHRRVVLLRETARLEHSERIKKIADRQAEIVGDGCWIKLGKPALAVAFCRSHEVQ